jgi:Ca-activated chloride channel family protein
MNFLAPEMLLGLLLIPIAIGFYLWAQRRRSRYAVRFTNLALLSNLVPKRPSWRRHLPPVLYLAAIAALLIGLARPTMVVQVPREDATVILAMDVSGSMRATDVSPTRLDAARASALSFIQQLPAGVRVGLVAFASEPVTLVSPTTDRAEVTSAINGLTARDGTAMGDALM